VPFFNFVGKEVKEMSKKVVWLIASCLIVVMLVVTSCGSAVTEDETETETSTTTQTESETVTFPDKKLEAAIRDALGKPLGEEITSEELAGILILEANSRAIANLSGLECCTSLTLLGISWNQIRDISPLANFTSLTQLGISKNQISDLSPLVENSGLGTGDEVWLEDNNLDLGEGSEDMENIKALEDRGVKVIYE